MEAADLPESHDPALRRHFTYKTQPSLSLEQGDLLRRTEALGRVIAAVHPYFAKEQYTHFVLLTQSCDTVQRKGKCKAEYLVLAPVRPLDLVIERELADFQTEFQRRIGVASKAHTYRLRQTIASIHDNNRSAYFYYEPDAAAGLAVASCAFLQVSITLKSDHYSTCLGARILSLTDVFQAKLGWHLSTTYSRVGTPEWVGASGLTEKEFDQKVDLLTNQATTWIDEAKLVAAERKLTREQVETMTPEHARGVIEATPIPPKAARNPMLAFARIEGILAEAGLLPDDPDVKDRLSKALSGDPVLQRYFGTS